jgi:hypothetical protein
MPSLALPGFVTPGQVITTDTTNNIMNFKKSQSFIEFISVIFGRII